MKQRRDRQRECIVQAARIPGCRGSLGSKAIAKKETAGQKELSSFCSREFHVCDAVLVNISKEATEKVR